MSSSQWGMNKDCTKVGLTDRGKGRHQEIDAGEGQARWGELHVQRP